MTLALRAYEFWLAQYRRIWRGTLVTSVVNPVFYLAALGIGLGTLVNKSPHPPGGVSYADFVAPGLLAAAAMQVAATESSWPVRGSFRWTRVYLAMAATPLGPGAILAGHQLFVATRVLTSAASYLVVIAAFGGLRSPLGVVAPASALLVGMAFAAPVAAISSTRLDEPDVFNQIFRFGIIPMFLFSGTFFPVSRLPSVLEWIAYATPLWHGVDLCRGLTLGTIGGARAVGHVAYLIAWIVCGLSVAYANYRRALRE
jgi:lipooligosaccharide transport system permease protein